MAEPTVPQEVQEALDRLAAKVESDTTVDGSAITLLDGLSAEIRRLRDEIANGQVVDTAAIVARLDGLNSGLEANQVTLSEAVQRNTEQAPA